MQEVCNVCMYGICIWIFAQHLDFATTLNVAIKDTQRGAIYCELTVFLGYLSKKSLYFLVNVISEGQKGDLEMLAL